MAKIKIGNKGEYPFRQTMGALLRFKHETGKDASKAMSEGDLSAIITFFYCCVKSACNADNVKCDLTLEDFADNIDAETLNAFTAAVQKENDAKKKARGKRE